MREEIINSGQAPLVPVEAGRNGSYRMDRRAARARTVGRLRLLWNHRRLLLRLLAAGAVISTIVAFLIPVRFESIAHLMPPDQSNSGLALLSAALSGRSPGSDSSGSNLGNLAGNLLGIKTSGDLFIGILQSRTVEDAVITKFNLRKVYGDRYLKDARKDLESHTDISADRKSGIIQIRVTDHDPKRAAALAGEYIDQLNHLVAQVNTTSAHKESVFLEGRLKQVKNDLETAEKHFSDFASKNAALDIPAQSKAMIQASAALKGQLIMAQTELEGLRQIYTDNNVRVRGMQARVNELQKQLQQLGGKYSPQNDSTAADGQFTYPAIRRLPILGVSYADLYRNAKLEEAVYETLTQEYELTKVEEAKETPSVKVIDAPDIPQKKYFPPRLWIVLGGAGLFVLLGAAGIFGKERWRQIDPQDPAKAFAVEIATELMAHFPLQVPQNGNGVKPGA
ncbi:MAG: GumC family protein [Candidatus Acidiferrales bacterium]